MPFYNQEYYQYSEFPNGYDDKCSLLKEDCSGLLNGKCPLKEGHILVRAQAEDDSKQHINKIS